MMEYVFYLVQFQKSPLLSKLIHDKVLDRNFHPCIPDALRDAESYNVRLVYGF